MAPARKTFTIERRMRDETGAEDEPAAEAAEAAGIRQVLMRYTTAATVDGILPRACLRANVHPSHVTRENVEQVIHEVTPGVRLFCRSEDVTQMMLELAQLIE